MISIKRWLHALGFGSNRGRLEREMDEEMRFHIDMEAAELIAHGLPPDVARRQARLAFGGEDRFKEEAREGMALHWLNDLRLDVLFALRSLRRSPWFTIVAVITLGIGIGAPSTIFGFLDFAAFRKLDVKDPDAIVAVYGKLNDASLLQISYQAYASLRANVQSFHDIAVFSEGPLSVRNSGRISMAWGVQTSDNYFSLLGLEPALGEFFQAGDRRRVAVLSDDFWRQRFKADPAIVGKPVSVNGVALTIIGVAPKNFRGTRLFTYDPSIWVSIGAFPTARTPARFNAIARLRDNATLGQAQREANAFAKHIADVDPNVFSALRFELLPNPRPINPWLAPATRIQLLGSVALSGVCLILVVACADVANLLLARMTVRRSEISMRLMLGATFGRLLRQLLTEGAVLALLGALVSLPLTYLALKASTVLTPPLDFITSFHPAFDSRVLLFTIAMSIGSAIVCGLAPLIQLRASRLDADESFASRVSRSSGARARAGLVVAQVAISVIALAAAGVLYRGRDAAHAIDVGFDVRHAVVFTLDHKSNAQSDSREITEFYRRLDARLSALPGVRAVSRATSIPLDGNARTITTFSTDAPENPVAADDYIVGDGYFTTMEMPIVRGSSFLVNTPADPEPVVVNETFARRHWHDATPIGRTFTLGTTGGRRAIVIGVARSEKSRRLGDDPTPIVWRSLAHNSASRLVTIIRTSGDNDRTLAVIPRVVHSIDPSLPVIGLRTLAQQVAIAYSPIQTGAIAGGILGALAAILAGAGLFGALSYNISQRAREIGVRRALGARGADIMRLVGASSLRLTLLGVVIAVAVILFIPGKTSAILYGVSLHDPLLLLLATAGFAVIAAVASLGPAWKALRIEPLEALRID